MAFNDLPSVLQEIYMTNLELGLKVIFIIFLVYSCLKCINYLKNSRDENKTPYMLVAYIRSWLGVVSYMVLFLCPLMVAFLLYPQVNIDSFHIPLVAFYYIAFFVLLIIFIVNILFFSGSILLRFAGFDANQEKTNRVLNDLEKIGGGMKIGHKRLIRNFMR